jgi:hypothetical protein
MSTFATQISVSSETLACAAEMMPRQLPPMAFPFRKHRKAAIPAIIWSVA